MRTYTGRLVTITDPTPDVVCIDDLAHHLGNENRWAGATAKPYAVAQHSVHIVEVLEWLYPDCTLDEKRAAFLHDGHEYLFKDVPAPIKRLIGDYYKVLTGLWDEAIFARFKVPLSALNARVKEADTVCANTERRDLFSFRRSAGGRTHPATLVPVVNADQLYYATFGKLWPAEFEALGPIMFQDAE